MSSHSSTREAFLATLPALPFDAIAIAIGIIGASECKFLKMLGPGVTERRGTICRSLLTSMLATAVIVRL